MSLTLKSEEAVAIVLEHVAALVRLKLIKGLSIDMQEGRTSRVVITFRLDPPPEEIEALKALEK